MGARGRTCCFTGYRPEKLPWGFDEEDPRCARLKQKIRDAVEAAYDIGMRHFICGMARGCDFYFAESVLALRRRCGDVTLEAAIPFAGQGSGWRRAERERWAGIVAACDRENVLQEKYTPDCMLRRNRYMVDHSALVIAVYDGQNGGTCRTLEYALRQQVSFVDIAPETV